MKDVFDNELFDYLSDEPEYKCLECDKPIDREGYCSGRCYEASMM